MSRKDKRGRNLRVGEYYDERNNRYMFRKMINGKRYTISNDDLAALRKEEANLMVSMEKEENEVQHLKKLTLDQYYALWCENSAKSGRKATTFTNYKAYYKAHVKGSELGTMEIGKIKKSHCQKLFNVMIDNGSKKSTLNNMKGCLSLIFAEAEDDGAIDKNPCRNIRFNHLDAKKREAISTEQVTIFMNFLKTDRDFRVYYPLFVVLFNLGLRVGEVCGITWDCIDLENNQITINKSMNRYREADFGFTNALGTTKSRCSNRTLLINDVVAKAFEMQRKQQLANGIVSAKVPQVDDYGRIVGYCDNLVFTQTTGKLFNEPGIVSLLHRIVKKQNSCVKEGESRLKYFSPHMIRHTYTTIAYENGVDGKEVAHRLGHESEITSRDIYTHLRGQKKQEQETAVNKIQIC